MKLLALVFAIFALLFVVTPTEAYIRAVDVKTPMKRGQVAAKTGIKGQEDAKTNIKGQEDAINKGQENAKTGIKGQEDAVKGKENAKTGIKGQEDGLLDEPPSITRTKNRNHNRHHKP